jgi:hypothetical protein
MTPEQKIKHLILNKIAEWEDVPLPDVTDENVDELYDALDETQDAQSEIRGGQVETGLPAQWSRHYESKAVAAQAPNGSWVGWTYWYGGGKHGEPEAIDWMDEAYDLNCKEEEKVVVVRTFTPAQVVQPVTKENKHGL